MKKSSKLGSSRVTGFVLTTLVVANTVMGQSAIAQNSNQVSLRFGGEFESVTGDLLGYEDGKFRLQTTIGPVTIPGEGVACIGNACPEGTKADIKGPFLTLSDPDSNISISGNLIEVKGGNYVLATGFGELSIAIEGVVCEGEGCVEPAEKVITDFNVIMSKGGAEIESKLSSFDDEFYHVKSDQFGVLTLRRSEFTCEGEACP